jgi:hypothetical protein
LLGDKCSIPSDNKIVVDAFPVFEEDQQVHRTDNGTMPLAMPNNSWPTPIRIMVLDTIVAVKSHTLLKVLFDPGLTATLINSKCLPQHCKPFTKNQARTINTLAGSCTTGAMVVMRGLRLPKFDKNRVVEQQKALVFDGECKYNVSLGTDFLSKSGIDIKYSSGTNNG